MAEQPKLSELLAAMSARLQEASIMQMKEAEGFKMTRERIKVATEMARLSGKPVDIQLGWSTILQGFEHNNRQRQVLTSAIQTLIVLMGSIMVATEHGTTETIDGQEVVIPPATDIPPPPDTEPNAPRIDE